MNLGKGIIDICNIRGISQKDLAAKTGLSITFHSLLENNLRNPSMETLDKIAEVLKVPVPIIFWFSLTDSDIKPERLKFYNQYKEKINYLIHNIFI
jgi:transcriptional regulator with XRE-family HTH domain